MEISISKKNLILEGGNYLEAGVRNKVTGEIEAIRSDEIMAEVKMRGT